MIEELLAEHLAARAEIRAACLAAGLNPDLPTGHPDNVAVMLSQMESES